MEKFLKTLQNNQWVIFIFSAVDIYLFLAIGLSDFAWFKKIPLTLEWDSIWVGLLLSTIIYCNIFKLVVDGAIIYFFNSSIDKYLVGNPIIVDDGQFECSRKLK